MRRWVLPGFVGRAPRVAWTRGGYFDAGGRVGSEAVSGMRVGGGECGPVCAVRGRMLFGGDFDHRAYERERIPASAAAGWAVAGGDPFAGRSGGTAGIGARPCRT